jgi:putative GTP pyrophosphokinase
MSDVDEFISKFNHDEKMLLSWGELVCQTINDQLKVINKDSILKIEPCFRVKDLASLIEKAFYRFKGYNNPYKDITDKVGVRFVVLLTDDIEHIKEIIQSNPIWSCSEDRDFEKEKAEKPYLFDYQSVHYVVRNLDEITNNDGVIIPSETPCEIQIRTLLQHAYAEVSHDSVYKCKAVPSSDIKRRMARTIALMESTDELFLAAKNELNKSNEVIEKWAEFSKYIFSKIAKPYDSKTNDKILYHILNIYFESLTDHFFNSYTSYLDKNEGYEQYFQKKIESECLSGSYIKKSSAIIFCLFMADKRTETFKDRWPFSEADLNEITSIVGK